jgi:DNA-directed RNA polymerase specialized sigma24 family protein
MASRRRRGSATAAGDRLSVEAAHYYARIYGSARAGCLAELRRAGCSEEDAEDIFATTLERIMRKFDPAYAPAQTIALLKRACREKLIDERRHQGVLKLVPLEGAGKRVAEATEGPAEAAEEREAVLMGREAIASLPERDRALFLQRHRLGLTPEEILRRNPGLSRRTYRKVMQRANARALRGFGEIGSGARCAEMRGGRLRRYVAEEAADGELAEIEAHLRHCRSCRLAAARMRGHLHDVAAGVAVILAGGRAHQHALAGWVARLLEAGSRSGDGVRATTRAVRERVGDLMLRAATSLPGSGGEGAAGQLVGVSAAKVASVCAAGALAAGCLAAGVVTGIGAAELTSHPRHRAPPGSFTSPPRSSPSEAVAVPNATVPGQPSSTTLGAGRGSSNEEHKKTKEHSPSEPHTEASAKPTISSRQTGAEFGAEAEGTGIPISPPVTESSGKGSVPVTGTEVGSSRSAGGSTRGGSDASSEFGL